MSTASANGATVVIDTALNGPVATRITAAAQTRSSVACGIANGGKPMDSTAAVTAAKASATRGCGCSIAATTFVGWIDSRASADGSWSTATTSTISAAAIATDRRPRRY